MQESLSEKQITVELELAIAGEKQEVEETQTQQAVNTEEENVQQCSACGGTGKCEECKGDGYRGSGYTVSCPRCHGTLTETCIYCNESGQSTKHEGTCDFPNCITTSKSST